MDANKVIILMILENGYPEPSFPISTAIKITECFSASFIVL